MRKFNNPQQPKDLKEKGVKFVTLFDAFNGRTFEYPLAQHEKFVKAGKALQKKGKFSEYDRQYYAVADFEGPDYPGLYHLKTLKPLKISTSLYEEIRRRNPVNPNIKTKKKGPDGKAFDEIFDPIKGIGIVMQADIAKIAAEKNVKAPKNELEALKQQNKELMERMAALERGSKKAEPAPVKSESESIDKPEEGRLKREKKDKE